MKILTIISNTLLKISVLLAILSTFTSSAYTNSHVVLYERFDRDPLDAMPAIETSDLLKRFLATTRSPADFEAGSKFHNCQN
jgi:hypothetical protein